MRIQVSHNADPDDPDWFVVKPAPGTTSTSVAGTPITNEMAVDSLRRARRSVYELEVSPWAGKTSPAERLLFDHHALVIALLGKKVRVKLGENVVQEGTLLGFGDGGDVELAGDDGMVYHCWPALEFEEVT